MTRTARPLDHANKGLTADTCQHCGSAPGIWCQRPNGDVAPFQHSTRYRALLELERTNPL